MTYTAQEILQHMDLLREKVFQTSSKWPQFNLLLNDIQKLSNSLKPGSIVISFERTLLYGGNSLIAPFFENHNFTSIDCSPESAEKRGSYNLELVNDPRFIAIPHNLRASIDDLKLNGLSADLVLVPNLIHHVKDQDKLFKEIAGATKSNGMVYIFEALVRELHQIPDDYLRYTPYGLEFVMKKNKLIKEKLNTTGGPFSAIVYCWIQALQYFPKAERKEIENWFYAEHFEKLMGWDAKYKKNLVRSNSEFPTAFSIIARKVN
jgi:SAM-dependent methyltransferase